MIKKRPSSLIKVPLGNNLLLKKVVDLVNSNEELKTLWRVNNINAIDRLGFNDHGPIHFQIVANIGLRLARLLNKAKVDMSVMKDYSLSFDFAEVIIFLGCVLHDIGMSINREGHEELSLFLADGLLKEILAFLPTEERVIVKSDILHAILSHRSDGKPITIEAGIVRVADALDMSKGRSRIPFEAGKVNIHSISAYSIDKVDISEGVKRIIQVNILMNNSAGIYQVDELLKKKLANSGLEEYFEIKAYINQKTEKRLIKEFFIK
ncbi:HD domain-containing protein [Candidatus Daviesbacteria bacterium]|nr:HD domain-containing protein [Candidatus Daviesbacteria bacterium]